MQMQDVIRRTGLAVEPTCTIRAAAERMADTAVGSLVVVEDGRPTGIVTDRDLVCRVLAKGLSPDGRVDGVMTTDPITIEADADLHDLFGVFRTTAVRRVVIVEDGRFVGVVSIDDLLVDLAGDLADLARPVTAEVLFGHHDSEVPATA